MLDSRKHNSLRGCNANRLPSRLSGKPKLTETETVTGATRNAGRAASLCLPPPLKNFYPADPTRSLSTCHFSFSLFLFSLLRPFTSESVVLQSYSPVVLQSCSSVVLYFCATSAIFAFIHLTVLIVCYGLKPH